MGRGRSSRGGGSPGRGRGGGARRGQGRSGGQARRDRGAGGRDRRDTRGDDARGGGARAGAGGKRGLGGEQIEGRQAVREALLAGRRRISEVLLSSELEPSPILDDIIDLADSRRVPIREAGRSRFESEALSRSHQGVLARGAPLEPHDLADLARPFEGKPAFLMVLDGVTDPGNLGAILRTAECFGATGVVLPRHRAARVTATVAKAAAGAIEHLRFASVGGVPAALSQLSDAGLWVVGLDASGELGIDGLRVADEPLALVLGGEGSGLSRLTRSRCDALASIPMAGELNSLNVSAAAAIACAAIARGRHSDAAP